MTTHIYTVSGEGDFPIDMLRYDASWPYQEADSRRIARQGELSLQVINLRSNKLPHPERWASFGWSVLGVTLAGVVE